MCGCLTKALQGHAIAAGQQPLGPIKGAVQLIKVGASMTLTKLCYVNPIKGGKSAKVKKQCSMDPHVFSFSQKVTNYTELLVTY